MLDTIFEILFGIVNVTGTIAGPENRSPFFKVLGCLVWLLLLAGVVSLVIYWAR